MLEKPDIPDEALIAALQEEYLIPVTGLAFLPVGNDASAWAYRVDVEDQTTYFLKVRTQIQNQAGFVVPRFLRDQGMENVLAPLPTKNQKLWTRVRNFFLILYPFVIGTEAMESGMSDSQWNELGGILQRIHNIRLPLDLSHSIGRETFIPSWGAYASELHRRIQEEDFDDPYQNELARVWRENRSVIQALIERTERIGMQLRQMDLEFVLCHADIHTANILLTPDAQLVIVDWDGTLLAPKERDLMFVLEEDTIRSREEQMFFDGYGSSTWNQLALAYYRYEWCVQETGDYGQRIFSDVGERTKQEAIVAFRNLFSPQNVIESALRTQAD